VPFAPEPDNGRLIRRDIKLAAASFNESDYCSEPQHLEKAFLALDNEPNRSNYQHQNDRQDHSMLGNVLPAVLSPKLLQYRFHLCPDSYCFFPVTASSRVSGA
jgi:hypothetical protein